MSYSNTWNPGAGLDIYGQKRVAVVILAKNEERTIAAAVSESIKYAHYVLVMDGRSTDRTVEIARAAGATVVQDRGLGKGAAIRQSLEIVTADVVVFMDADGSHDPADIPKLALPVVLREADLCIGSRFSGGSDELSMTVGQLIRTIGNVLMNIAINQRWNVELTDTLNGFRAGDCERLRSVGLKENRHTIEQETVMKMLRHGYLVMNVPAHEYKRAFGESHINIWSEWPKFVWCVFENLVVPDKAPVQRKGEPAQLRKAETEKTLVSTTPTTSTTSGTRYDDN